MDNSKKPNTFIYNALMGLHSSFAVYKKVPKLLQTRSIHIIWAVSLSAVSVSQARLRQFRLGFVCALKSIILHYFLSLKI